MAITAPPLYCKIDCGKKRDNVREAKIKKSSEEKHVRGEGGNKETKKSSTQMQKARYIKSMIKDTSNTRWSP